MTAKQKDDVLMNYRLAYRKVTYVNWCEALGTVLANDEVRDGVSERRWLSGGAQAHVAVEFEDYAYAEKTF
ncbi:MAG: hypothetical protein R2769_14335 [Saprospiraceae bacterium]